MKDKLYHVADRRNIKSILKHGLIPRGSIVYLSEDPDSWYIDGLALLEVDITGLNMEMHTWLPNLDEINVRGI